jgi:sec-independent protein translocase protein TatA
MGIGGIGVWQLLIILAIVVMLFGTSRLKNMGSDLGSAIKGFKKSIKDEDSPDKNKDTQQKSVEDESKPQP